MTITRAIRSSLLLGLAFLAAACITINVYFPEVAAEKAADRFVQEIYGDSSAPAKPANGEQPNGPQSALPSTLLNAAVNFLLPTAAAADFDANSPASNRLKANMKARHADLKPFYDSGAVGLTNNAEVTVRDLNAVPLPQRNRVRQLVAEENNDRAALYREIASTNGNPDWENDIRNTFGEKWIANAPAGWHYQDGSGAWQQK